MADVGKNIRQLRIRKNLTQEALAEKLFVTRQTVSNYETGKSQPDIDTLMQLAQALDADMNTILYGLPVSQTQKRNRKWALIGGAVLLVMIALYYGGYIFYKANYYRYFNIPAYILDIGLRPGIWLVFGWLLVHGVAWLCKVKPLTGKAVKPTRVILCVLLGAVVTVMTPYVVWMLVCLLRHMTQQNVQSFFPDIPVYTPILSWLLPVLLKRPYVMMLLGGAFRLLELPYSKA